MKLTVEKQGENVKAIKAEYTPAEALIINHAMRRYACDEEINATDRKIMEQMLEVEPIFTDFEHKAEIVISQLRADRDRLQETIEKIRAEIEPKCDRINSLASVLPYTAHREIQELLCEIMDLCKAEKE